MVGVVHGLERPQVLMVTGNVIISIGRVCVTFGCVRGVQKHPQLQAIFVQLIRTKTGELFFRGGHRHQLTKLYRNTAIELVVVSKIQQLQIGQKSQFSRNCAG